MKLDHFYYNAKYIQYTVYDVVILLETTIVELLSNDAMISMHDSVI